MYALDLDLELKINSAFPVKILARVVYVLWINSTVLPNPELYAVCAKLILRKVISALSN